MTFDVYVVGDGEYVYTLMPTTETKDWSTLKPAMEKLVQSFRVLK
jgi:predicted Zn-dependent protease